MTKQYLLMDFLCLLLFMFITIKNVKFSSFWYSNSTQIHTEKQFLSTLKRVNNPRMSGLKAFKGNYSCVNPILMDDRK